MRASKARTSRPAPPPLSERARRTQDGGGRTQILDGAGALGLAAFAGGYGDDAAGGFNIFAFGDEDRRAQGGDKGLSKKKKKKKKKRPESISRGELSASDGAGHAEDADGSGGARSSAAHVYARLSRPPKKNFRVVDLDVATLRPLVDLAYWSTFTEVRRDAAAAFATLAMNEANLPVLSEAGALGAVIALIGMNNDVNDTVIQRDAAIALSFLVRVADVRSRFIKAPDGLRSVFYICRSSSVDVRRACVNIFMELSRTPETKEALAQSGGIKYLFALAQTNDEVTVRKATQVLKKLAAHGPNHEAISNDAGAIKNMIGLLLDCPDLQIRRDMMSMVSSIASSQERRENLVHRGVLTPLLLHLDPQTSSLETIVLVIQCLLGLSSCPEVLPAFVEEGVVENLGRVIFDELKEIRRYRAARPVHHSSGPGGIGRSTKRLLELAPRQTAVLQAPFRLVQQQHQQQHQQQQEQEQTVEARNSDDRERDQQQQPEGSNSPSKAASPYASVRSARSRMTAVSRHTMTLSIPGAADAAAASGDHGLQSPSQARNQERSRKPKVKTMAELEQDALRFGLMIFLNLAAQKDLRDALVDRKVQVSLYEDSILHSTDKRVPRLVAKTLSYLAESDGACRRHTKLLESGVLHPIRVFLRSKDFHLRTLTLALAANLTIADQAKVELGSDLEMLKQFVGFCNIFDEDVNADLAVTLARISEDVTTFPALIRSRALDSLMFMISPRSKNEVAKRESVRALGNLARDVGIKQEFVQSGALGHLISLSKSGNGLTKMYALQTLTALEHDTAAIRIQMVFRGYRERKNYRVLRAQLAASEADGDENDETSSAPLGGCEEGRSSSR